jgi:DNA-binding beta-propeller fold protein YncE
MVVFTPDGRWVLTADEGEPSEDYAIDPEGTVSIIDMSGGVAGLDQGKVRQADFRRFDGQPTPDGFRIARRGVPLSKDVEPEYIAVSADSRTAWVTLQENNGLAIVDIASARVTRLVGFGYKDHRVHPLDPSDRDGGVKIAPWPVFGMYQPDSIARFERNGATYLVTANEGDSRDWKGFSEEKRVAELKLDPAAFPNAEELRKPEALGRLRVTNQLGDTDGDGVFKALYAFGARSFSVWDSEGRLVWDSGDQLERLVAERLPDHFNANHANNKSRDDRSDDKGPEPEGVAVAVVGGVPYAFIGLERIGGVVVYSLADPRQPRFIDWVLNRDFKVEAKEAAAGDLGPEGLMVIPAENAPGGKPILVVTNEVSGTTTLYAIEPR